MAFTVVIGFFLILGILVFHDIDDSQQHIFNIMLGVLGTMTTCVINYYFGGTHMARRNKQNKAKEINGELNGVRLD